MPISPDFIAAVKFITQPTYLELLRLAAGYITDPSRSLRKDYDDVIIQWNNFNTIVDCPANEFLERCDYLLKNKFSFFPRHHYLDLIIKRYYLLSNLEKTTQYLNQLIKAGLINQSLLFLLGITTNDNRVIFEKNISKAKKTLLPSYYPNNNADYFCVQGIFYRDGCGDEFPEKPSLAAECFQKAVKEQSSAASYFLGELYLKGKGVAKDENNGLQYINQAALAGHRYALFFLGDQLSNSTKDQKKHELYMKLSAVQGHRPALVFLADRYSGKKQSYFPCAPSVAINYYRLASAHGNKEAQASLNALTAQPQPSTVPPSL